MKKIIRLTESGLDRIVRRVINEDEDNQPDYVKVYHMYKNGEVTKKEFYSYMGILEDHERQGLIDYIESQKKVIRWSHTQLMRICQKIHYIVTLWG